MRNLNVKYYNNQFIRIFILMFLTILPFSLFSQNAKQLIREGNMAYKKGDFKQAEKFYNEAYKNDQSENKSLAAYNLGSAFYKQKQYDTSAYFFNEAIAKENDKELKSKAYHNLGNAMLKSKNFEKSIEAYKNSLKLNSEDEDTRYNLAYAKKMLQVQQQQQQQNQDKNQKQDQKQDQKPQENKDDKEKKDKEKEQKEPKPQEKMSKEEAERMLKALKNKEQDLQNKKKDKVNVDGVKPDKDW